MSTAAAPSGRGRWGRGRELEAGLGDCAACHKMALQRGETRAHLELPSFARHWRGVGSLGPHLQNSEVAWIGATLLMGLEGGEPCWAGSRDDDANRLFTLLEPGNFPLKHTNGAWAGAASVPSTRPRDLKRGVLGPAPPTALPCLLACPAYGELQILSLVSASVGDRDTQDCHPITGQAGGTAQVCSKLTPHTLSQGFFGDQPQ